ncbi:hypothetical protein FQA39_LY13313 [Lamprigera yunnana]|nr:hypothetical protein FQA39_LY13313 [Lamprigera yunnana]
MGDHKCPYCMKKVTNLFSAIKCHLCKNYYYDSCSKRVKTRSDGAFIKCCGDDDILDISDGVSSDVVNGQGDLDFHDASSAIENKLEISESCKQYVVFNEEESKLFLEQRDDINKYFHILHKTWKPMQIGSKSLMFEIIQEKKVLKIEDSTGNRVYLAWGSIAEVLNV